MASASFESAHSRWLALTRRDPSAHCSFLYGVRSTRIYCRPTCSARLARRANIVFYDDVTQARHDGFRPCKRCKPDDVAFVNEGEELVTRVMALLWIVRDSPSMKLSLKNLSSEVGVTPSYLCRVFKKVMRTTIGDYMKQFDGVGIESSMQSSAQLHSVTGPSDIHTSSSYTEGASTEDTSINTQEPENHSIQSFLQTSEECDTEFDLDDWVWTGLFES